jgi:UDP-N-acetylmuramate--alanine ligase
MQYQNMRIHMVGIKGVGMTALTEILVSRGAHVSGSDTPEVFYTDAILKNLEVPYYEEFLASHITEELDLVIHSAAYAGDTNPELTAASRLNIPIMSYPEALGVLSKEADASGIAGVHGKTTTTALTGTILKRLKLPVTVLVGSQVPSLDFSSTYTGGHKYFVAETCEYRRNFLTFRPARIVITSIEPDHLDYFKDMDDITDAFVSYAGLLPEDGELIYHYDDSGARRAVETVQKTRPDIRRIPYGREADGPFRVSRISIEPGKTLFCLEGFQGDFEIHIPGEHTVFDAAAAIALTMCILKKENRAVNDSIIAAIKQGLLEFKGSRRRSEVIGTASGILFMDDYAHHPTAVRTTLAGLKAYYPHRRLVVDFMSHTYSRTKALLPEFGTCFTGADEVILHKIYASAREKDTGDISGRDLFAEVKRRHNTVRYFDDPADALPYLKNSLAHGDLFVTMGAGNNWTIGRELFAYFSGPKKSGGASV